MVCIWMSEIRNFEKVGVLVMELLLEMVTQV